VRYLVDTSALVRIVRRQVDPNWYEQVARGLVAICDPVITETLTIADASSYADVEESLRAAYPWVPVPDDAWEIVTSVRRELAAKSAHHGLSDAEFEAAKVKLLA
jgi:predicted nucleic acid-binding protein